MRAGAGMAEESSNIDQTDTNGKSIHLICPNNNARCFLVISGVQ
jgi:hypothetical protein